jgi:hypothetical protein
MFKFIIIALIIFIVGMAWGAGIMAMYLASGKAGFSRGKHEIR